MSFSLRGRSLPILPTMISLIQMMSESVHSGLVSAVHSGLVSAVHSGLVLAGHSALALAVHGASASEGRLVSVLGF